MNRELLTRGNDTRSKAKVRRRTLSSTLIRCLALLAAVLLLAAVGFAKGNAGQEKTPAYNVPSQGIEYGLSLRDAVAKINRERGFEITLPVARLRIVVFKEEHLLKVYCGSIYLKSYIVSLGQLGLDDKEIQGDYLTPEGVFYLVTRNPLYGTKMFGFMGISYPNSEDAVRIYNLDHSRLDLAKSIITAVRERRTSGFTSLWYKGLGGEVGIHGGSLITYEAGIAHGHDWTLGCIGMSNADIIELRDATPDLNKDITPVLILSSESELDDPEMKSAFERFLIHPDPFIDKGTLKTLEIPAALKGLFETHPDQ